MERVLSFMTQFDLLCCPCVMVAPFDVDIRYDMLHYYSLKWYRDIVQLKYVDHTVSGKKGCI